MRGDGGPRTQTLTSIVRKTDLARQRVDTWRALVVSRVQTVSELLEEYGSGLLSGAEFSSSLLQVLAGADIDAQLAEVPPDALDWVLWEQQSGHKGLRQVQYAFLELPKYQAGKDPETLIDKWAYFFREAKNLEVVPPALAEGPVREALEIARRSTFTDAEWLEYERAKMAEQDERGAISLAHRQGEHKGRIEARAGDLLTVLRVRGIAVPEAARERILAQTDPERLERWLEKAIVAASLADAIDDPS